MNELETVLFSTVEPMNLETKFIALQTYMLRLIPKIGCELELNTILDILSDELYIINNNLPQPENMAADNEKKLKEQCKIIREKAGLPASAE